MGTNFPFRHLKSNLQEETNSTFTHGNQLCTLGKLPDNEFDCESVVTFNKIIYIFKYKVNK